MENKPKKLNLIKKLILQLNFHCWEGKYISNDNPYYRISIIESSSKSKRVHLLMYYCEDIYTMDDTYGPAIYCDNVETLEDLKLLIDNTLSDRKKYIQLDQLGKSQLIYKIIELEKINQ